MFNYTFLVKHFGYKKVELCLNNNFTKYIQSYYSDFPKQLSKNKFGYVFYEFESDFIFHCGLGEFDDLEFKKFEHYISLLPAFTVENICYLLSIIDLNYKIIDNPFVFSNIEIDFYSSSLLIDTYGKLIYIKQLKELIMYSNFSENSELSLIRDNSSDIFNFAIRYNDKEDKVLDVFKKIFTPTDLSLFQLLKYNTPLQKRNSVSKYFGVLTHNHKSKALEFVRRANKYFPSGMENLKWTPKNEIIWNDLKYQDFRLLKNSFYNS